MQTFFGFRDSDRILWEYCLKDNISFTSLRTIKASVTAALLRFVHTSDKNTMRFYCGPKPIMMIVAEACMAKDIECFVSLEERMACGIGACLGCACRVQTENDKIGYGHVCKDGPVFNARKVVL